MHLQPFRSAYLATGEAPRRSSVRRTGGFGPIVAFLTAALSMTPGFAHGQDTQELRRGQTLSGTLDSDSRHAYRVALDADRFVLGEVNQISVDVVVLIVGPDGDEIAEFDLPARGPEIFTFESDAEGSYQVVVTPFQEQEGEYTITLRRVERVATDPEGRVDQMMAAYDGPDTPGVVVGVYDDGEIVFQKGYGMANLTHDVPFTADVASNIGSVTKHFTAMGILLLEQDGMLSLDDDIREHIPELPDFGTPVTLRNLLNHTSGYRELYNHLPFTGRQGEDEIRREEAIHIVQRQPDLQDAPSTAFNYNNTGYILLATTIERVSEQSFPEFMEERVFAPLGMTRTRVKYVQGEIIPNSAKGYVPAQEGGYREVRDLGGSAGAGGIYTTAEDMGRWVVNWREGTVGGAEALAAITTPAVLQSGDTTGYGLGMGVTEYRGRTMYTHTGGDVAHRTFFAYLPELDAGVFVSSNNASFSTNGRPVIEAFFEEELEAEEEEEEVPEGTMSQERMEAIEGEWSINSALPVTITLEDGGLVAEPQGQPRFPLRITSDSTASYEGVDASVVFHFEEDGSVDRATHVQGGEVPMLRVEESAMTAEELEAFTGRYYSDELEMTLRVRATEDGELEMVLASGASVTIRHASGTDFGGAFPFNTVSFEQAQSGVVTGFTTGNGRTTGLRFRRW